MDGGINTYGYANQNPVSYVDPTGEAAIAGCFGVAAAEPTPFGEVVCGCYAVYRGISLLMSMSATESGCGGGDGDGDGNGDGSGGDNNPCGPKDPCKGLRDQVIEHEKKLAEYEADPYGHDNQRRLADSPEYLHAKIISGRIANLKRQIASFKKEVAKCERDNMNK